MSEKQSNETFEDAYELYREIRDNRGLHLRHGNGRDDVLIEELCDSIGCPDTQIADFLREENRSAEWLMREFLQLAAPFARMFLDIWDFLSNKEAPKATEDLRIRFGFNDDFTDIDLEEFRELAEIARKVSIGADVTYWSDEALHGLFEFSDCINLDGRSDSGYYPGEPYQLPAVKVHYNDDFEKIIRSVRNLFQNIINKSVENEGKDSNYHIYEKEYEGQQKPPSLKFAASMLTDLLPSWELIFEKHHEVSEENRREAVEFFQENIEPKIELERILGLQNSQTLLDILRLPFWEKRWHTYEIWMTVQTLRALDSYGPRVRIDNGRIPIDGRDTAVVADLERVTGHNACIVSELETPHEAEEWNSIRPDLSICRTQELDKESRAVVIEYKQRSDLSSVHVEEVAQKYLSGAPKAVGLVMVNYDDIPDVDLPNAAELIENVRPNSPTVGEYHNFVQECMKEAKLFEPFQQWTVLVDVSGSMGAVYMDQDVKNALLKLIESSSNAYKFNDGLTQNPQISPDDINMGLQSKGGTDVEVAIEELNDEYDINRNLLVVTDGNYSSPESLPEELERIEECSPRNISSKLDNLNNSHFEYYPQ